MLAQLAADASTVVRAAAAGNSAMTAELLKQLRKDAAPEVQAAARRNASYQPGFFGRLLGR